MQALLSFLIGLTLLLLTTVSAANHSLQQQTRSIHSFHSIQVDGPFDVTLVTGKAAALSLNADEVILPWIATSVSRDQLIISMKPGIKPHYHHRPQIQVSTDKLDDIVACSHASLTLHKLQADSINVGLNDHSQFILSHSNMAHDITISATDHSQATLSGEAKSLLVNGTDHCRIDADELTTAEATINLVNHSTAVVSTQQAAVHESNHSVVKLGPETTKIRGHLQNHSRIDAPQSDTTESFVSNDAEFD